ncbi:hypothetical protein D3C72_1597710 [compost metagenome]
MAARSSALSRSPSASSALCVANSMRSASTRDSTSARACMSCWAVEKLSCNMVAIWSSDRPYEGLTATLASTPLPCSLALTLSRPSASTVKVTRMRAAPAAIGGMPRSVKRARLRQSDTRSRSPCTTCSANAVWPSW